MKRTGIESKFEDLKASVGNTPLFEISFEYKGRARRLFAKAEYYNYTGSIKDRIAWYILKQAYETGELRRGMKILEATSGNTGIALSAFACLLGHEVVIYMPDWMSSERINLIRSFGANVRLVSSLEGGFRGSIEMVELEKEKIPDLIFLPRQFDNQYNSETHYNTTGPEIVDQLNLVGLVPDGFVAGVGTGGTVMGVGRYLKDKLGKNTKVFPLEPSNSPTLTTGYKIGKHRIQGISDEFIPSIVNL
ncbi:pyridoxal-phosphate dependent enzyme, partial [Bacteroidales bacterium OttesenSCG-928-M11]|nr:pyridoxal-phosphate dependent enzyme [Bacteroidales bacterium OttesenSCG-928-M11]